MRATLITYLLHGFARLPRGCGRLLGALAGRIAYRCQSKQAQIATRNLQLCFPGQSPVERDALLQKSLIAIFQLMFEVGAVWFRGAKWRKAYTLAIHNEAIFHQACASGRGVLVIIPHFGNWEMALIYVAQWMKATAIYRPPKIKFLDPVLHRGRNTGTLTLVPPTVKGVMKVFKALRRSEMSVILPDQVPSRNSGVFADFFGTPAYTMTLVHKLIKKTNPVVLQAYAIPRRQGFELGFMQPHSSIYSDDEYESVAGLNKSIEALVRLAPEQYLWEYKRFKKCPDGKRHYFYKT